MINLKQGTKAVKEIDNFPFTRQSISAEFIQ